MSTHNIGFYENISKIMTELSSNIIKYALISSADSTYMYQCVATPGDPWDVNSNTEI